MFSSGRTVKLNVRNELENSIQNLALLSSIIREAKLVVPTILLIELTKCEELYTLEHKIHGLRHKIAPLEVDPVFHVAIAMLDLQTYRSIYVCKNDLPVCKIVASDFGSHDIIIDLCKFMKIYKAVQKDYGPRPLSKL